jgi:hypothetical protein
MTTKTSLVLIHLCWSTGFVPDVETWSGPILFAAMAASAIPLYAEATHNVRPRTAVLGYSACWSLNYIACLEHGRNVCTTTHQGVGTIAAKIVIVAIGVLMIVQDLRSEPPPPPVSRNRPYTRPRGNQTVSKNVLM